MHHLANPPVDKIWDRMILPKRRISSYQPVCVSAMAVDHLQPTLQRTTHEGVDANVDWSLQDIIHVLWP